MHLCKSIKTLKRGMVALGQCTGGVPSVAEPVSVGGCSGRGKRGHSPHLRLKATKVSARHECVVSPMQACCRVAVLNRLFSWAGAGPKSAVVSVMERAIL